MHYRIPSQFSNVPLYKKAMDIIVLSRSISTYLSDDLCYINSDGCEDPNIYFIGDIVQQSSCLAPEIVNAQREVLLEKKNNHVETLNRLTYRLYNNCKRLETSKSNGKDYLNLLKKEIKIFRRLQRTWVLTL